MISDERLREAARQAEKDLLASLPKPEDCEATFSPEFKQKMKTGNGGVAGPTAYVLHGVR